MLKRLVDFALHQRFFVIGGVLTIVAFGFYALTHIPFDAYPDLTGTRVEVITSAPGMPPEDVERLVTYPLESTLMGIQGAENVRSVSKQGLSLITVSFPDKVDVYFARTLVQQRVADAVGALPAGIEPGLGPVSTPMGELYQYTVTSDSMSLTDLKTLHDYTIRPRLRVIPGVSEVNSWGGFIEQIHVVGDPAKLAARDLTLQELHDALDANNRTFGGAYVETAGERFTIRGMGRAESLDEIGRMVVATRGGAPVLVRDVARVERGALPRQGAVTQDGKGEVVTGMVLKLKGADSRRVIRDVRARLDEVREGLPSHVHITPFYDQTQLIQRTTKTITKNLIEGGLLVIAVLFLFLRNWRASLIVASVIPLSMLFAFGGMHLFGYGANLMSLGALDFGLIVDASVVMVENFVRRLEEGTPEDRRSVFLSAAVEVGRPILFGIAIIVAVYIPIFTLDGMEGRMFKPMAFTVVTAVLGSLLLALTYVPAVASIALKHDHEERPRVLAAMADGRSVGCEALVRWQHPVRGLLQPDDFILVAEENGLIIALGNWVLKQACFEAVKWERPFRVAVNLSALHLQDNSLVSRVHEILVNSGLSPARLEIEITESALFLDQARALSNLRRLKALGVRIAMDDFGTGYSSLSTLNAFPFDRIKIDRSFVDEISRSPQAEKIVRAIVSLGHSLGVPITAEGVETETQLEFLRREGCDQVQGFLIGRPEHIDMHAGLVTPSNPGVPGGNGGEDKIAQAS